MGEESLRPATVRERFATPFTGGSFSVRQWGVAAGLSAALVCFAVAAWYYAEFSAAPLPQHVYGAYYGLRNRSELFSEYAVLSILVAAWMSRASARLVLGSTIAIALLVLNVAFAWTSGVLPYLLVLIPKWLPQSIVIDYLAFVQVPAARADLDYYYLAWLGVLFLLAMAFFRSRLARRLVHSLELVALALLALPVEVYLFDRREFNIRVTDAQLGTRFEWFTNADLLAVLLLGLSLLVIADRLLLRGSTLSRLARRQLAS